MFIAQQLANAGRDSRSSDILICRDEGRYGCGFDPERDVLFAVHGPVPRDCGPRGISGRLTPCLAGNALRFHVAFERHGLSPVSARKPANAVADAVSV
jgi:hypothetical protein